MAECYADRFHLIIVFEGIRSERQLLALAADRLSVRWYLWYDLDEALPDHSSLTRIRDRYGVHVFRRFFERIVEQCQHPVPGDHPRPRGWVTLNSPSAEDRRTAAKATMSTNTSRRTHRAA